MFQEKIVSHLTRFLSCSRITTMETQTIKIWKKTLKKLRMIYALTGKSMVSILDYLVTQELLRVQQKKSNADN